ncbi:MAG: hypothetical protein IH945_09300, partial [Armatimonadetes bacterium]|nr:hypothetical protein [Armatimonadota bacterium]
ERSKSVQYLQAVTDWLDWYGARIDEEGRIFDHEVIEGGAIVEKEGQMDAMDSYASTYLNVLHRWWKAKGDAVALHDSWPSAASALSALQSLRQDSGLTIAKPDYPVMYLMDNTETYAGLTAGSEIVPPIATSLSVMLRVRAYETLAAIDKDLWDEESGRYHWAISEDGKPSAPLGAFYPDTMAQLMAIVRLPRSERRIELYRSLKETSFPPLPTFEEDELVWWLAASLAAGDEGSARMLAAVFRKALADSPDKFYSFQIGIVYLSPPAVGLTG